MANSRNRFGPTNTEQETTNHAEVMHPMANQAAMAAQGTAQLNNQQATVNTIGCTIDSPRKYNKQPGFLPNLKHVLPDFSTTIFPNISDHSLRQNVGQRSRYTSDRQYYENLAKELRNALSSHRSANYDIYVSSLS
ncbi:hypothetical protein AAG570_012450 [Ranatra chinensis]|uniref:Uncharacterized protein n=1 Tax=Ranatra chinensis TaxID=642074 RepID=A0ABD0YDZ0_9HEMI